MFQLKKIWPHALAILGFVVISLIYFYPVLQGKKIFQSDIAQYTGMAKEQIDFRAQTNTETYWTNSAFGGMPTYQLGAKYPHDYIGALDDVIRFLPRPADYLFLYFIGFYVLMLVLKIDPLKAFIGALAFGLSTYLIIILGVGHNAKAHALGYMPFVVAGTILVFRKKYILGGILTMLAIGLELNANHFQVTYYFLFLLLILSCFYGYKLIKDKDYKSIIKIKATFIIALILGIGVNATGILATKEYTDFSTRGKNTLTFNPDGSPKQATTGLDKDYITDYSYGIAESFNLIAPRLFGGSNVENLGKDSHMYEFMISQGVPENQALDFAQGLPTYWGDQPGVSAPAYIGAVIFFLAILVFFLDNRKIKYVFLGGALISLILSWGKNISFLTDFMIDYFPLYNKFRAVSSFQMLLEFCVPVLAILGLDSFFKSDSKKQFAALWKTAAVSLGLIAVLFLFKSAFNFAGQSDGYFAQTYGPDFVNALKNDRKSLYNADLLRSGFFILMTAGVLYFAFKNSIKTTTAVIVIGILLVGDLFFMDKNYVSKNEFVSAHQVDTPFGMTQADEQILQDSSHYRVFEIDGNMNSARASYFHKSIGGYSAVKPQKMQQLFDYQISKSNLDVVNMLNVKYIIQQDTAGNPLPSLNPEANGNAWFIKSLHKVTSDNQEIKSLNGLDTKNVALININSQKFDGLKLEYQKDSIARIKLDKYAANHLKYTSFNVNDGFAVFSEMYYKNGWKATVDGKETQIYNVDYVLRGIVLPAGNHKIEFKFEPQVVKTGSTIVLMSSIAMILIVLGGIYFEVRKKKD